MKHVSMFDIFQNAKEYQELAFPLQMTNSAVLVFLTGFITDAYLQSKTQIEDEDGNEYETCALFENPPQLGGEFDMNILNRYIELCESENVSFDLFDEENPFLQIPRSSLDFLKDAKIDDIGFVDARCVSGNNSRLIEAKENHAMTSAEAIAALITQTRYAANMGGRNAAGNLNGADLLFFFRKGQNLYETIVLNMLLRGKGGNSRESSVYGIPWYRCMSTINPENGFPEASLGWLNGTFFMRTMYRLILDSDGYVRTAYKSYALGKKTRDYPSWIDPYQLRSNSKNGVFPIKYAENRFVCYDEPEMFQSDKDFGNTYSIFKRACDEAKDLPFESQCGFMSYGQQLRKGSTVMYDTRQDITICAGLLQDSEAAERYRIMVKYIAEDCRSTSASSPSAKLKVALKNACLTEADQKRSNGGFAQTISDYVDLEFSVILKNLFEKYIMNILPGLANNEIKDLSVNGIAEWNLSWRTDIKNAILTSFDSFTFRYAADSVTRIRVIVAREQLEKGIDKKWFPKTKAKKGDIN